MDEVVLTTSGYVRGLADGGLIRFAGLPYGQAERWRAPHPMEPWRGIVGTTEFGTDAPQPTYSLRDEVRGGEDCLNLDIVRPNTDEVLPVVVYLHGGSFVMGSSHEAMLQGDTLVSRLDVVYVSVNFRLGVFGYLDLRTLGEGVANPGTRDQLLALEWVRENIASFGGDPGNVTLMGESAGGAAVTTLMCVPAARGLFHKAIAQSAPVAAIHSPVQSRFWAAELVRRLDVPAEIAALRELPAEDLVRAGMSMMWRSRELLQLNSCFGPTVDGSFVVEHPLAAFAGGRQAQVPLLIGTNNDEASFSKLFYLRSAARRRAALRVLNAYDADSAVDVRAAYDGATERSDFAELIADAVFWAPSMALAERHSQTCPTWMYRFDYAPVAMRWLGLGAIHSAELTAVFGNYEASRLRALARDADQANLNAVTEEMQELWGSFFRWSTPGTEEQWPRYRLPDAEGPGRATKIFDATSRVEYDPKPDKRLAWKHYNMLEWSGFRTRDEDWAQPGEPGVASEEAEAS